MQSQCRFVALHIEKTTVLMAVMVNATFSVHDKQGTMYSIGLRIIAVISTELIEGVKKVVSHCNIPITSVKNKWQEFFYTLTSTHP